MRTIPDDNLGYPVLITLSGGSVGSGFYVKEGEDRYLVTARHLLFREDGKTLHADHAVLTSYSYDPSEHGKNRFACDLQELLRSSSLRAHASADVAVIRTGVFDKAKNVTHFPAGCALLERTPSGISAAGPDTIKYFDAVLEANDVYVFGYPRSLGLKAIPQLDHDRPLLRKGIVAGRNLALRTLILDCPVYPGNSGGPVLEVEQLDVAQFRFSIIGVVSQFVPLVETWVNELHGHTNVDISNSGYTVVTPMDFVRDLTRGGNP